MCGVPLGKVITNHEILLFFLFFFAKSLSAGQWGRFAKLQIFAWLKDVILNFKAYLGFFRQQIKSRVCLRTFHFSVNLSEKSCRRVWVHVGPDLRSCFLRM